MNMRAQLKILMGKPIITQETSYKLKENIGRFVASEQHLQT